MLLKIRSAKIKFYIRFMNENGFNSEQVLAGTGLTQGDLEDPNYLIDNSSYIRIVFNIQQLFQSSSLAFELGKSLTIGDLGILGYAMMSSQNTLAAYQLYHQYSSLFFGNLVDVIIESKNRQLIAYYVPNIDTEIRQDLLQFFIEERINIDVAAFQLCSDRNYPFPVTEWAVTYNKPTTETVGLYKKLIDAPIRFSASENKVVLKNDALSIAYPTHDKETNALCLNRLEEIHDNFHCRDQFSTHVKQRLFSSLSEMPIIDDVAKMLFCSKRTLNRKLALEDTTFAKLVAETRLEAIINYAVTTNLGQQAISEKLGFSDVRSLRRFFKRKVGKTISDYKSDVISNRHQQH